MNRWRDNAARRATGSFLAQFTDAELEVVIGAAVYLHGLAAEVAVEESSEQTVAATDLLQYLPKAIERVSSE